MAKVTGLGAKLLSKMGWREGTGLGVKNDGRTEPVKPSRRSTQSEGIGLKNKPVDDQWWTKLMVDAYGPPAQSDSVDLLAACEGRRCRPHGKAKLARLDAQDRATKLSSQPASSTPNEPVDKLHVQPQISKKKKKKNKNKINKSKR